MRYAALAAAVFLLAATAASSAIIYVPGDYPTISQAVAAAMPGDSVAVGPGTHADDVTIVITIPLTLYSTDGAEATAVDGANALRILYIDSTGIVIRGFSFVNGVQVPPLLAGGAMAIDHGSAVVIEDCVFRHCVADGAGAIYVSGQETSLVARRCRFEKNTSVVTGGAVYVVLGATATFEACIFLHNETQIYAGAVHAHRATMNFERCLFQGGRSGDVAGALYYGTAADGFVRNCTFFDHTSPGNIAGTIVAGSGTEITRSVFVGETHGYGVRWYTGEGTHSCNVFWNNARGAMGAGSLGLGDVVADPLFCDAERGDFTLAADSPCLPGNHPHGVDCGLIGAFGQGCGPVSIEELSWGRIKWMYRGGGQ